MDEHFRIRPAKASDIPAIAAIEREVFTTPWPAVSFHSFLSECFLALWAGEQVVGYAVGRVALDEGEILNLAVSKPYRRSGFGHQLLLTLVGRLADNGAEAIYLEVRESNGPARGLYGRFGFQTVGRRRGYYADPVEDALVLRLEISGVTGVTKKGPKSRIFG